jgi:hypothetical protein
MRSLIRGSLLDGGVAIGGSSCLAWFLLEGKRRWRAPWKPTPAEEPPLAAVARNDDPVHLHAMTRWGLVEPHFRLVVGP